VAYAGMTRDIQNDGGVSFEKLYNQLPTHADAIEDVRKTLESGKS
jgi:hypothetical protein